MGFTRHFKASAYPARRNRIQQHQQQQHQQQQTSVPYPGVTLDPGATYLHHASAIGDASFVQSQINQAESAVDVLAATTSFRQQDANGWQPVHEAARSGHVEVLKLLLEADNVGGRWRRRTNNLGVNVNARTDNGEGETPLRLVEEIHGMDRTHAHDECAELIRALAALAWGTTIVAKKKSMPSPSTAVTAVADSTYSPSNFAPVQATAYVPGQGVGAASTAAQVVATAYVPGGSAQPVRAAVYNPNKGANVNAASIPPVASSYGMATTAPAYSTPSATNPLYNSINNSVPMQNATTTTTNTQMNNYLSMMRGAGAAHYPGVTLNPGANFLHHASDMGDVSFIQGQINEVELLTSAEDIMAATAPFRRGDRNGWQPVHEAARSGHINVLKLLLEVENVGGRWRRRDGGKLGIDVNARTDNGRGETPLRLVEEIRGRNDECAKLLRAVGGVS
eukprot:CAMPEP_0181132166 /NCGR_PEP_ID=MMETSP1071-20121207/30851_1 /TAXON_ID=35127 /ORGANISM="Thalassiosira sp., Strain NH16" /LENGTH=450 /DNA_ID=CAMNT_0023218483 /DNA_START=86 /DNA_END=1439 /DNA_ORIENTATION=+